MTNNQLTDERLVKILSETQATIMEHNSRCVRGSVEVDARLFESMIMELQERRKAAMDSEPVAWLNGCNKSVPAALRYLAENPRPIGGESSFNAAHLYQLAREIELMAEGTLYRHAQPAPVSEPVFFIEVEGDDWINAGRIEGKNRQDLGLLPDGINYLYAAPQPAPVVPDAEAVYARLSDHEKWSTSLENVNHVLNACRAAMLASAPQEVK
ncbi:TPA: hypothetical protein ACTW9E_003394 [Klebsiella michiganensis]